MDYFAQFQITPYINLDKNDGTYVALTNILTRSAFLQEVLENTSLFYDYAVKDGETAEIIADKLYGDVKRHWIVLLFNKLLNPYYDFPLTSEQLNDYIKAKYSQTLEDSQTTIHHYYQELVYTTYFNGIVDSEYTEKYTISQYQQNSNTGLVEARPSLPGVADTSIFVDTTLEDFGSGVTVGITTTNYAISNYTYELEENEKRRKIKLLDAAYVGNVESEFRRLMING